MSSRPYSLPLFFTLVLLWATGLFSPLSAHAKMDEFTKVKLQTLNKITARTSTFIADVGNTVQFGPLFIRIQACRKAPPIENPESAAFLQIWQQSPKKKSEWVFSGWMFASSPALSPMDHPIYDVWVLDCPGDQIETLDPAAVEIEMMPEEATDESAAQVEVETEGIEIYNTDSYDDADIIDLRSGTVLYGDETDKDVLINHGGSQNPPEGGPEIQIEILEDPF